MKKLHKKFFERNSVQVAQDLLGCFLVHQTDQGIIKGKIVETEAYGDATDLASHARFESRKRNEIMFGEAGILYVYHIYGIFYLTNIICEEKHKAGAVLLRAAEITEGKEIARENLSKSKFVKQNHLLATGPGKLSLAFKINKSNNFQDITEDKSSIFFEERKFTPEIIKTTRVGIDYAGKCKDLPWRFYIKDNNFISKQ